MSSWRTATSQDANSDALDPQFLDPNNLMFGVSLNSPAQYSSFNPNSNALLYPLCGTGALNRRIGISNNVNSSYWTGATMSNLTVNADGSIGLTNPNANGTWTSGVIDLQSLSGFSFSGQTVGLKLVDLTQSISYPLRVLDSDNTDTKPNRLTLEVATSSDGVNFGNFVAYEPSQIMNLPYRYIKLRITFRQDGVSA